MIARAALSTARPSLIALLVLFVASPALADEARLDYAADAVDCPTEAALREAVAMHLGYDPFTSDAERVVRVRIESSASGVIARVQMLGAAGESLGRRDLEDTGSCAELADVLVLAVSIAIDPSSALGSTPPIEEPIQAPEVASEPLATAPAETMPEVPWTSTDAPLPSDPWLLGVGVSVLAQAGFAPSPTAGASLDVHVRRGMWSVGIAGFGELPAGADVPTGRVVSYRAGVAIVPCVLADFFGGCAVIQLGALVGHGERVPTSREASALFIAVGARAQIGWTFDGTVRLAGFVDVLVTPTPTELLLDGQSVWSTGIVAGVLGASASLETAVSP